ncbi:uncharacterized protein TNCV_4143001 [Trichonephila clavipes]|nr:uncharacterized protein TNCV_4143001 [Trichonephila clavipes]
MAFDLQQHTASTAGVMVWGAIAYNTWCYPSIDQWHHDILQPHVLPLMQQLPGAIFQQYNAWPHTRKCQKTVSALLLPFPGLSNPHICLQSSISEIIWDGELGIPRV